MVPLFRAVNQVTRDDEEHYLKIFNQIEINKGFYFSYTYDLTHSLQENITRKIRTYQDEDFSEVYADDIYTDKENEPTSVLWAKN